jgi:hypothetical protein
MKSLHDAMLDPDLFGTTFGAASFANWRAVAKFLDGLPLEPAELELWRQLSARETAPAHRFSEGYLIKPRRSGGTLFASAVALHAALSDYRERLGPGEVATVALIASDRRQARQAMNFCTGLIEDSPIIRAEVVNRSQELISFSHRVNLEIHTTSFRSTRGYSYAAVILDELAFFRSDESANPDVELVRAVRPGLANLHGRLLGLSSPHAKRGHLYDMHRQHFGQDADVLVLKAGHAQLNPTIDPKIIARALAEDPEAARSEWFGEFRGDVSQWLADELIDAAVVPGRTELGCAHRYGYLGFVDVSGGAHDSSVLAIAHAEPGRGENFVVLDRLDIAPAPHSPHEIVARFASVLMNYGLRSVTGDKYGANFVVDAFKHYGIGYRWAELDKSAIYGEVTPLFSEKRVEILENRKLITELRLLERKPRPGGRPDSIDHPPRSHDDAANAACGAMWLASKRPVRAYIPPSERPEFAIM